MGTKLKQKHMKTKEQESFTKITFQGEKNERVY